MPRSSSSSPTAVDPGFPDPWTVVQVASFLSIPYQDARNNMLAGDYGPSNYDAKTRKLTVAESAVRVVKSKRGRRKKTRRKRS